MTREIPRLTGSAFFLIFLFTGGLRSGDAQDALHLRINQAMSADLTHGTSPLCSDADFLRRVSIDLLGAPPTSDEVRAFLADGSADKRAATVDRILAHPRHPLHLAEVLNVMLMERRRDQHVPAAEWMGWLQTAVRENRRWTHIARDLLTADGTDEATRPAAKFLLDRDAEPNLVARDIGRIFFGIDLQCAQCHDHPLVEDYRQIDYYGLFAFVNRTSIFTDEAAKKSYLKETAEGDAEYKSVFTGDAGRMRPRLPGGLEIDEPRFRVGEEYSVVPDKTVRGVPKYSRRAKLGELVATGENDYFARNIANRMWALLMGRGLVAPIDFHHPDNPPAHPEVLALLVADLKATGYDLRHLLREIALTDAYQRSLETPSNLPAVEQLTAELSGVEQSLAALTEQTEAAATALQAARDDVKNRLDAAAESIKALDEAGKAAVAARKPVVEANAALAKAAADLATQQNALKAVTELSAKAKEVLPLLPNDAEAASAAAVFEARVTKLTETVATLEKTRQEKEAAVATVQPALDAAWAAVDVAAEKWVEGQKPILAAKEVTQARRSEWSRLQGDLVRLKGRRDRLQTAMAIHAERTALAALAEKMPVAEAGVVAAQQAIIDQQSKIDGLAATHAETQKTMVAARQAFDATVAAVAKRQGVIEAVKEAGTKAEFASAELGGDEGLTGILASLKERSDNLATGLAELQKATETAKATLETATGGEAAAKQAVEQARTEMSQREAARKAAEELVAAISQEQATRNGTLTNLLEKHDKGLGDTAARRDFKALSPEQMLWSIFQVTGVAGNYLIAAEAEIEKTMPAASVANDAAQQAERQRRVVAHAYDQLKGNVGTFASLYGGGPGQPQDDFFATAEQALFLANGGSLRGWLSPGGTNLTQRLLSLQESAPLAEELFLTVYGRPPVEAEVAEVAQYLASRGEDRSAAVQELAWALVTSAEFRFQR